MFKIIGNFIKRRKIRKAVGNWKVGQTVDQLVHSMANGLVENLEKSGLDPDEIESAVKDNSKFITKAVEQGISLMSLCDQVKESVLAKEAALKNMEAVVIKSQCAESMEKGEDGAIVSTVKKVGSKVKSFIKKEKTETKNDKEDVETSPALASA